MSKYDGGFQVAIPDPWVEATPRGPYTTWVGAPE